ncbi:hypothetical protein [Terasakiella pusilla]|uniref:hypothetical protein n=1 Tax=Terasakiella pusilla TaxID=64973 RepID=UPI003AA8129B
MHLILGGALIGALCSGLIALASGVTVESLYCLVDQFQSLIAGFLALIGAAITVWIISLQLQESQRQFEIAKRDKVEAEKAATPLILSSLCDYAQNCANLSSRILDLSNQPHAQRLTSLAATPIADSPSIDKDDIQSIKKYIEFGNEGERKHLKHLLNKVQVQIARLRGTRGKAVGELPHNKPHKLLQHEANARILEAAEVYAIAGNFFEHAREEGALPDETKPSLENMLSSLRILGLDEFTHPDIFKIAAGRYDNA